MSKISMSNGASVTVVAELNDAQIEQAMQHVLGGDDDLRETIHAQGHEDERAFLAAYCTEHQARFGQVFTLP